MSYRVSLRGFEHGQSYARALTLRPINWDLQTHTLCYQQGSEAIHKSDP